MIERPASELIDLLSKGDATAEGVAAAFLKAIREREPRVKAFLHVDDEERRLVVGFDRRRRRKFARNIGRERARAETCQYLPSMHHDASPSLTAEVAESVAAARRVRKSELSVR